MNPHTHEWSGWRQRPSRDWVRRCYTCGQEQHHSEPSGSAPPLRAHEHLWSKWEWTPDGYWMRKCATCDEDQVSVGIAASDPHVHHWVKHTSPTGVRTRECPCGEVQTLATVGPGAPDLVADHGGIVGYDARTELITTGDGTSFTLEALTSTNPRINSVALRTELERKFAHKRTTAEVAEALTKISGLSSSASAGMVSFAEVLKKFGAEVAGANVSGNPRKQWTSDDALTLILEEIKHDPDPMRAAGRWITKMTNAITDIVRNLDDDDER